MTDWATFAATTVVLTLLLLYFTRRTQRTLERVRIVDSQSEAGGDGDSATGVEKTAASDAAGGHGSAPDSANTVATDTTGFDASGSDAAAPVAATDDAPVAGASHRRDEPVLTTAALLANAALSQLFALLALVGIAWWTAVPASAFGIGGETAALGRVGPLSIGSLDPSSALGVGIVVGAALYAGNEAAARLGARVGVPPSEGLREAMAPGDARGWALLLGVVLPIVAVFEEALFRGALIGALALGFAIDPWLLAVGSSVAFGLGHGAQGRLGVVVTTLLGFGLAAVFIVTGSLLVVIVAHYVVNALEFVVRETLGIEPI